MINADNEIIPRETVNSIYGDNYDLIKIQKVLKQIKRQERKI